MELLATQVWVLLRSPGVLAAWAPLRICLFARELRGAGLGSAPVWGSPRRALGTLLRFPLRVRGVVSGGRQGNPGRKSAAALWRGLDSPAPPQPGAGVERWSESPTVFQSRGHGGGPGSRGGTNARGAAGRDGRERRQWRGPEKGGWPARETAFRLEVGMQKSPVPGPERL